MSTNDIDALEQQRQRRNHISRIKSGIILAVTIWMMVSILAIVILTVQVVRLSYQVEHLLTEREYSSGTPERNMGIPETEISSEEVKETETDIQSGSSETVTGLDSAENMAKEGDTHKVYLTFDGGPDENTDKILDVLEQYDVKATFFVSGNDAEDMKEVYKRIIKDGHTLGMHSYSNQYSTVYGSVEAFEKDFDKLSEYLEKVTGKKSIYYRFPGGSSNGISNVDMTEFVHILNEKGITYFDWNVSSGDTSSDCTVDDVVKNVTDGVKKYKTSVVLLHDSNENGTTAEALGPLIDSLKKMKAEILPIDQKTEVIQYIKADSVE